MGGGVQLGPLRPITPLVCQPRVIIVKEKLVELVAGETEVLEGNLPHCRFDHHKPHLTGRLADDVTF
jgi:hypothetical protein